MGIVKQHDLFNSNNRSNCNDRSNGIDYKSGLCYEDLDLNSLKSESVDDLLA